MAINASKITGIQSDMITPEMGIANEQITADVKDLTKAESYSDLTIRVAAFIEKHPSTMTKVQTFAKTHPYMVRAGMAGVGAISLLSVPVAATDTVFGVNTTEIDGAFSLISDHIMPGIGKIVSGLPPIFIPLVIVVVLVMVLMFVPGLLSSVLEMLKSAIKFKK